jgi:hypothetical protein
VIPREEPMASDSTLALLSAVPAPQ